MAFLALWTDNKTCQRCYLRSGCTQVVTGVGDENASLLIVGEAPGADEDIEGEPFVGRSGQLLRKLLKDANINPSLVYITNVVKCRPKDNTTPDEVSISSCKPWLWEEIKTLAKLKVILPLGGIAIKLLLKTKQSVGKVIEKIWGASWTTAKIMPWYHPSYILRNNNQKLLDRSVDWFKKIRECL